MRSKSKNEEEEMLTILINLNSDNMELECLTYIIKLSLLNILLTRPTNREGNIVFHNITTVSRSNRGKKV